MRASLESGGHRLSKLDQLKNIVYTHFRDARDRYLPFHGHDLKGWSLEVAKIVNLTNFKASASFLRSLKTQSRIPSRKVTKFITERIRVVEDAIRKNADKFVTEINGLKSNCYVNSRVRNTDQSGFNYELLSSRTLSDKREKKLLRWSKM